MPTGFGTDTERLEIVPGIGLGDCLNVTAFQFEPNILLPWTAAFDGCVVLTISGVFILTPPAPLPKAHSRPWGSIISWPSELSASSLVIPLHDGTTRAFDRLCACATAVVDNSAARKSRLTSFSPPASARPARLSRPPAPRWWRR